MSASKPDAIDTEARHKSKELAARAVGAEKLEAAARKEAQKAKARWKQARRALKQARRAAKQARKAAKAARKAESKRDGSGSKGAPTHAKSTNGARRPKPRPNVRRRARISKPDAAPVKQPELGSPARPSTSRSSKKKTPLPARSSPIVPSVDSVSTPPAEQPNPGTVPDSRR